MDVTKKEILAKLKKLKPVYNVLKISGENLVKDGYKTLYGRALVIGQTYDVVEQIDIIDVFKKFVVAKNDVGLGLAQTIKFYKNKHVKNKINRRLQDLLKMNKALKNKK